MYRLLICLLLSTVCCVPAWAQSQPTEKKGILLTNELSFGLRLNSNGWGIFGERAKIKNIKKTRIIQFGFDQIKHAKEKKQSAEFTFLGPALDSPKDFFYGKRNDFFTLKVGYGFRNKLAGKAEKNGVSLSLIYLGGVSLGFLKPYYLDLAYRIEDNDPLTDTYLILSQRYTEENAEKFLDWTSISGASGFRYGWREVEPIPGGYGKVGLNFEWGSRDELVASLEAGIQLDVYYKTINLMVTEDNAPFFLSAYISFQFGKRW